MENIALVLVTFNRSSLLIEMLSSVLKLSIKPASVYIIDNNSTDSTASLVNQFISDNSELSIKYFNTGANLGGAGGFAYGSKLAYDQGHEWIWLADDDVEMTPNCLEELIKYKNKSYILQPMRINMDGSCAEISGLNYKINSPIRLNPKKITVKDISEKNWDVIDIETIPFEGPLIHRSVFSKIGFPDPDFFIFYDDLDFALRAQKEGFKIICVKSAKLKRKIPFIQSRALGSWKGYFMYRNFFFIQKKHGNKLIAYFRNINILILVSLYSILKGNWKEIPMLVDAFKDAMNSDFSRNQKYKPS